MLETHDVYLTDWRDARNVPVTEGTFDLEDYTEYLIEFLHFMGPGATMMGVCQPGVAALAATALMSEDGDSCRPASLILMGSPIDTRISPTEPTKLADEKSLSWFESNMISLVPLPNPGAMRRVYPGFLQLSGFMSMNMDRHLDAAWRQFSNLVEGDGDSTEAHRTFYDEYLAVMDLTAEFYLQTIDVVFQRHLLPLGEMTVKGRTVNLDAITDTAIMTVEGGRDDITGEGQTHITHTLTHGLPEEKKRAYTHPDVGHYGVFNGSRWRNAIQPEIASFIAEHRT
jgi:poly(3-hydroxybutyrate) depolymerase